MGKVPYISVSFPSRKIQSYTHQNIPIAPSSTARNLKKIIFFGDRGLGKAGQGKFLKRSASGRIL
ncbi:MAG: hypothetical protein AAGA60_24470 [Cyanobacteria bacterium P01_E01_bin.42]